MSTFRFDHDAYLRRIHYSGETAPTSEPLKALHHAHLYTIPFENFDIQLGRGIDLNPEHSLKSWCAGGEVDTASS